MSNLTKVRFDKSTTVMDRNEELYWMHFLSNQKKDPIVGSYIASQLKANPQYRREIMNQPVCERCECFAFHHKEGVMCSSCGHFSRGKTHKVKIHLAEGYHR